MHTPYAGSASGHAEARPSRWMALAGWIALAAVAGAIGGAASLNARDFYAELVRPGWAPPGWLFGPVWTVLYILIGIAAWLVWGTQPAPGSNAARSRRAGLQLFIVQLALNALWTWLFFAWRQGAWASVEIVALWLLIAATLWRFGQVRPAAAWLMVPYLAWVSFASALTWTIWQGNPDTL